MLTEKISSTSMPDAHKWSNFMSKIENRPNLAANCLCLLHLDSKWKNLYSSRLPQLSSRYFLQNVFTIFHSWETEVYILLIFCQIFCYHFFPKLNILNLQIAVVSHFLESKQTLCTLLKIRENIWQFIWKEFNS